MTCYTSLIGTKKPRDSKIFLRSWAFIDPLSLRSKELNASNKLYPDIEFNLCLRDSAIVSTQKWVFKIFNTNYQIIHKLFFKWNALLYAKQKVIKYFYSNEKF